ncbi:hypothetical protein HanOQP8_Chr16g0605961 [Helianthus annuus]|nr:hypothetical protein HanOQP8_Chr16g0605961 [Helianthus annuus]
MSITSVLYMRKYEVSVAIVGVVDSQIVSQSYGKQEILKLQLFKHVPNISCHVSEYVFSLKLC